MIFESFFLWIGFASSAYFTLDYKNKSEVGITFYDQLFIRLLFAIFGIFLSKLFFHLLNPSSEIFWNGGFVYIGFLSSYIIFYLGEVFCGKVVKISDSFVIPLLLSYSIGRIGCYFAGCCFGEIFLIPVQLFESLLAFVFCCLAVKIPSIGSFKGYLYSYFLLRFITEFFRTDLARGIHYGISTTQWIIIFYGIIFILLKRFFVQKIQGRKVPT